MVPELEERDAMIWAHYTRPAWMALDWQERAATLAHFRLDHLMRLHTQEAQAMDAELRQRMAAT